MRDSWWNDRTNMMSFGITWKDLKYPPRWPLSYEYMLPRVFLYNIFEQSNLGDLNHGVKKLLS